MTCMLDVLLKTTGVKEDGGSWLLWREKGKKSATSYIIHYLTWAEGGGKDPRVDIDCVRCRHFSTVSVCA